MKTEAEIREKLAYLKRQHEIGQDAGAVREIQRLEWVLGDGPDFIHIPKPGGEGAD